MENTLSETAVIVPQPQKQYVRATAVLAINQPNPRSSADANILQVYPVYTFLCLSRFYPFLGWEESVKTYLTLGGQMPTENVHVSMHQPPLWYHRDNINDKQPYPFPM